MNLCIESLGEEEILKYIEEKCGYWEVNIEGDDYNKKSFMSQDGLYYFIRIN